MVLLVYGSTTSSIAVLLLTGTTYVTLQDVGSVWALVRCEGHPLIPLLHAACVNRRITMRPTPIRASLLQVQMHCHTRRTAVQR